MSPPIHGTPPTVSTPQAPWHMWGTTQRFEATIGAGGQAVVVQQQFGRITYRRPENWRFLLTGRLLNGTAGVGSATEVYAKFDIIAGVGRSNFDTIDNTGLNFAAFCTMHWTVPIGTLPGRQPWNIKYATEVLAPPLDDSSLTTRQRIDHVVAEDLQVRCNIFIDLADPNVQVIGEVGSFWAPNVHLRPEWYRVPANRWQQKAIKNLQFVGNELGGK